MLIITILTIGVITKPRISNMILALSGYLVGVVSDYVLLYIFQELFHINEINTLTNPIMSFIFLLIFFITTYFLLRIIKILINKFTHINTVISKPLLISILLFLLACGFIFIFNHTYENKNGYTPEIVKSNFYLFGIYFILTMVLISFIIISLNKEARAKEELARTTYLVQYTEELENLYWKLRSFRHDYSNIIFSMQDYLERQDYKALDTYYKENIMPLVTSISGTNPALEQLIHMKIPEVKSILYIKIIEAEKHKIPFELEIKWDIDNLPIQPVDIARILGILIDNAIESGTCISVAFIKQDTLTTIIIDNKTKEACENLSSINQLGNSTKGQSRGIGLYNVHQILSHYDNVTISTRSADYSFTQTLEIYGE
jgi:two-component system sensor histidine kinase AgrC